MHKIAQSFNNKIVALKLGATTYIILNTVHAIINMVSQDKYYIMEDFSLQVCFSYIKLITIKVRINRVITEGFQW